MFIMLDAPKPGDKATEISWLKQYDDNLKKIENRCSDVMLGKRAELL
jgi:hypothetical protein